MNDEHHDDARTRQLCESARTLSGSERAAFLERTCVGNPALRRQVEALLADPAATRPASLAGSAAAADPHALPEQFQSRAPRNYRILRRLGAGGMGQVFLAERSIGDGRQQVALKLMQASALLDPESLRRFAAERHILAELNHPNIAHLVDGGSFADGQPFLALEYVEGSQLDQYCQAAGLDVEARLRLFRKVCGAVQYAHQRLVIHRDLKPGNILVGADGEPKLLDFGIARLLEPRPGLDATLTRQGGQAFTPAYASPEQILGEPLSTATDVYSLGVVLYELLAGRKPFDSRGDTESVIRAVLTGSPPAPSRALAQSGQTTQLRPARKQRPIPADLDAIVLKAMAREPEARYDSVQALQADLERFLQGRPVQARRANALYRARKFIARHRLAVGLGLLLLVALAGFGLDRQLQLERTRIERARAEQVVQLLQSLFEGADPLKLGRSDVRASELLDLGAQRVRSELAGQPELRAALLQTLATAYSGLGLYAQSGQAAAEVLALHEGGMAAPAAQRIAALRLAAEAAATTQQRDRAEQLYERAIDLADRELPPGDPLRVELRGQVAAWLTTACDQCGERAEALARAALDEARAHAGADSAQVLQAETELAQVLDHRGQDAEARRLYEAALPRLQQLPGAAAAGINAGNELGRLLQQLGEYAAAEQLLDDTLAHQERVLGKDNPRLYFTLVNLAAALHRQDRFEQANAAMQRALELARAAYGPDSPALAHPHCNSTMVLLGSKPLPQAERNAARLQAAAVLARECVRLRGLSDDVTVAERAHAHFVAAEVELQRQDHPAALQLARTAFELMQAEPQVDMALAISTGVQAANAARLAGEPAAALPFIERSTALAAQLPPEHGLRGRVAADHAELLLALGRREEARERALEGWRLTLGSAGPCNERTRSRRERVRTLFDAPAEAAAALGPEPECPAAAAP